MAREQRDGLRILPALLRGRRALVVSAVVLSLASAAGTLALPLLVRDLVVALTEDDGLLGAVARMAALALAAALASALSGYLLARAGEGMVAGIRSAVVGHVLRMRLRDVRREGTGNLVARVSSDSSQLRSVVDVGAAQLPSSAVLVAGTLVVMGFLDWVLLLVVASTFAVAAAGIGLSMRTLRQGVERQQSAIGRMSQQLTAALIALPTIKAFRAERQMAGELSGSISGAERAAVSVARTQALTGPVMQLGQQVAIVGTMVASGVRLGSGALTAGEFAAFLVYLLQLISPLTMLIAGVARMQTGLAARGRLASVLTEPTERYDDREGGAELIPAAAAPTSPPAAPAVVFEDVSYEGDTGQLVVDRASFSVGSRGLTALVGPSGAGKTTLLGLVEGFLRPGAGRIQVLGRDLERWPLSELRGRITYVDQSFTLVEGTVRQNLALGQEHPPADAELWDALDRVGLRGAVERLPEGLDTELGRTRDLSGGQRQRLAVARAVLRPADLVLFDEPTSQLDSGNEELLRTLMDDLARTRAVLVVAHRISTVQNADRIVVLDSGRVTATGTHEDLMHDSERYRRLVDGQVLREAVTR
ncbi:ABC transporter ATP-binding protein [Streptomyces sp. NBC_00847]|uniref:ABC transporter ATP-binding protein n=1 Tax=unclassified Streptomyces TaxID=2593676 RepID=UPI0022585406|nr:ABC transporter ATP-binding protein [Streptomyces sp. NBC_00847]MCX4882358.1 ABC transporter ATP-binding protein/permease [Streptomyces sp. NBC_00847]